MPIRYAGKLDHSTPALIALMSERRFAPSTAGMLMSREYFIANGRDCPVAMPAVIVLPEREMPGMVATACAQPISSASRMRIERSLPRPGTMRSET